MNLPDYLSSPQAREDVRALLEARKGDYHEAEASPGIVLAVESDDAWTRIDVVAGAALVSAYYRPDGGRFIVSDLGEGVRSYRLRTGNIGTPDEVAGILGLDLMVECALVRGADAATLPDAIVRVMLASCRVARLGAGA